MSQKNSVKLKKQKKTFKSKKNVFFDTKEISGLGISTTSLLRGRFPRMLGAVGRAFSYTTSRAYGTFFLSFGLFTLFLNLGEYYFRNGRSEVVNSLIMGCVLLAFAIPFLFSDKPICIAFQDFPITDFLFFEFFSIKRMHRDYAVKGIPSFAAFLMGVFPALLAFFVSPETALLVLAGIIFVSVALTFPEFPVILTLLILPYMSFIPYFEILLACLSVLSFLSFFIKVLVGKRVYHFDIYTVLLFLWMLFAVIGGFVVEGNMSLYKSLYLVAISLGYLPASNLMINRRLADCAINAIIVSALPLSIIAITEFIIELPILSFGKAFGSADNISATFSTSSALAAFLVVSTVLTMAFVFEKRSKIEKRVYFVMFLLNIIALILTMKLGAWLAMLLVFPASFVLTSRRIPTDIIILLFILPHLIFLLPENPIDTVYSFFGLDHSFSEIIFSYKEAFSVFADNILFGVSISGDSVSSSNSVADSANLMLGLGVELGVFVLAVFIVMIIVRLRHLSAYRVYYSGSNVDGIVKMTAIATFALLFFGVSEYVFSDSLILYLFLSVFGICGSSVRTAKKENDERLGYYSDARSSESSAIDISLR